MTTVAEPPIPTNLRARPRFVDRYGCTNCGAPLDLGDPTMYTCTNPECGDEWAAETVNERTGAPGTIVVGVGDTVTFRHGRGHLTGVVTKINRRSIVTRHPNARLVTRTVTPEKVVTVTTTQTTEED